VDQSGNPFCGVLLLRSRHCAVDQLCDRDGSVLRYEPDKRFAAAILLAVFASTFGLLSFASWDAFQRPISRHKGARLEDATWTWR
jgi:hypothetical protein